MNTPHTDWLESHPTPLMGRHYTQTYYAVPRRSTFRAAWEDERHLEGVRARILAAAKLIVDMEQSRPLPFYTEATTIYGKMGAWDHGHVGTSTIADIFLLLAEHSLEVGDLADRARNRLIAIMIEYAKQKDSWLLDTLTKYGTTGRCRISAMILRALLDCLRAFTLKGHELPQFVPVTLALLEKHVGNVISRWPLNDGPQGDGLLQPHWRAFQVGILAHVCDEIATANITGGVNWSCGQIVLNCRQIIVASVARTDDGKPYGFYYDVPEPLSTQPWTSLPGYKLGSGNGVEPWIYKYLPDDAKAVIDTVSTKLHPAVKAKFGMKL